MAIQQGTKSKIQIIHLERENSTQVFKTPESKIVYSRFYNRPEKIQYQTTNASLTVNYVIEGEENLVIDDQQKYNVKEGQFLLIKGGRQVTTTLNPNGGTGLSIFLSQELIQEVLRDRSIGDNQAEIFDPIVFEELVWGIELTQLGSALREIQNNIEFRGGGQECVVTNLILKLRDHAQQESNAIKRIKAAKLVTRQEIYKRIHAAREYMHRNLCEAITLDELANVAHISKYHFLRLFASVYGVAPFKYLQELRLQRAYNMLTSHQYSVTEVASILKFNDLSYFSNRFKSHFGFRPSQLLTHELSEHKN